MKRATAAIILGAVILAFSPARGDEVQEGEKAIATVRKLIASVRLKANEKALGFVGLEQMCGYLLDKDYDKLTPEQKQKFQKLLGEYIELRAFPLAIQYIGKVDLSYDKPVFKENKVHVKSSVVYRGSERLVFTWVLTKVGENYLITDFLTIKGNSSLETSRDKQVQPVYKKQGAEGLLKTLEAAVKKLRK